jgi:hypothetical protein
MQPAPAAKTAMLRKNKIKTKNNRKETKKQKSLLILSQSSHLSDQLNSQNARPAMSRA